MILLKLKILDQIYFTKFTNYCSNDIIDFNDSTYSIRPIISWNWDFNDGNYSNLQNTSHNYINNGNYTVKLSISNDYGCIGEEEININIEESPIISLSSSSMVSCVNEDINSFWDHPPIYLILIFGNGILVMVINLICKIQFILIQILVAIMFH